MISNAHPTGWLFPQSPTPYQNVSPRQVAPINRAVVLIPIAINHLIFGLVSDGLAITSSISLNVGFPSTKGISRVYVASRLIYYLYNNYLYYSESELVALLFRFVFFFFSVF